MSLDESSPAAEPLKEMLFIQSRGWAKALSRRGAHLATVERSSVRQTSNSPTQAPELRGQTLCRQEPATRSIRAELDRKLRFDTCHRRQAVRAVRSAAILIVAKFENVSEIAYGRTIRSRWRMAPQV